MNISVNVNVQNLYPANFSDFILFVFHTSTKPPTTALFVINFMQNKIVIIFYFQPNFENISSAVTRTGNFPTSPYTVWLGVDWHTPKTYLQSFICNYQYLWNYKFPKLLIHITVLTNKDSLVLTSNSVLVNKALTAHVIVSG